METNKLDEIRGHLGAALSQSLDSDDQIIMQHVRDAYVIAGGRLEWHSSQKAYWPDPVCAKEFGR